MSFKNNKNKKSGFLLVELLVSVFIFALVSTASVGAILTVLNANKKTQALKSVMNNLNLTLDTMSRIIATGSKYHCGDFSSVTAQSCPSGSGSLTLISSDGAQTSYYFDQTNEKIKRCTGPLGLCDPLASPETTNFISINSPDVHITYFKFYAIGAEPGPGDLLQPRVTIMVKGYAGDKPTTKTIFNIQTTLSQRMPDF